MTSTPPETSRLRPLLVRWAAGTGFRPDLIDNAVTYSDAGATVRAASWGASERLGLVGGAGHVTPAVGAKASPGARGAGRMYLR